MGWIHKRHMRSGGSIGGMKGMKHKGPLREVEAVYKFAESIFDRDYVLLRCGHKGLRSQGATRCRCAECGQQEVNT